MPVRRASSVWRRWSLAIVLLSASISRGDIPADEQIGGTPRSALQYFLDQSRHGHYAEATAALARDGGAPPDELARQLKAVIDTYLWIDLDKVSDNPEGKQESRLPPNVEEIGRVPVPGGTEPLRLVRQGSGKWVFSASTLQRVPGWYADLKDRWIRDHLPEPLVRAGWRGLLWWQWAALPALALLSYLLGQLLSVLIRLAFRRVPLLSAKFDGAHVLRLGGPLTLLLSAGVAFLLIDLLVLNPAAHDFVLSVLQALALVSFFWGALRAVDLGIDGLRATPFTSGHAERRALLPLFRKTAKLTLAIIAAITVLQKLGLPVASLIAGLGIGGLAIALAAQKTVENLLGSVIIGIDQPFRPGDTVKIEDFTGTVESVGLRSTRIRTPNRTIITLPNGRLSDMRIETFAPRDRIRLNFTVSLVYTTTAAQLRSIVEEIRQLLEGLPDAHTDPPDVFFTNLGTHALEVSANTWLATSDRAFNVARQSVLISVMEIVARNGSAFAFPTRTVRLEQQDGETGPSENEEKVKA